MWQPPRSQDELGTCRVTLIGALTWPVTCTHTSREAYIFVSTKFTGPGGMWHCTQSAFLCDDFSHVSRYGHISWQSVPQNLLLSVNFAATADAPTSKHDEDAHDDREALPPARPPGPTRPRSHARLLASTPTAYPSGRRSGPLRRLYSSVRESAERVPFARQALLSPA